jgi:hypothetical protein
MRTWLDHMGSSAIAFRSSPNGWHVDFASEDEAKDFARSFYGRMLNAA